VLARWQHPTEGLITPNRFIEKAERGGWIDELTRQILCKAFTVAATLPENLTLAINISPFQLLNLQLPRQIQRMALDTRFELSRLIVEITESAIIDNLQSAAAIVTELKAMGCRLALDDFGTGYSSLHHLQSLPFDELKVDRSFVSTMTERRESRKIVSAVVGLGQSLGLITVAEGIETQEQAEMMLWLGCELGQGYFFGRPMPAENLSALLSTHRNPPKPSELIGQKKLQGSNLSVSPSQRLAQLQAVYDGAPVGLAFVDRNLRYMHLNKQLADMNGLPVEGHLGRTIPDVLPEYFPSIEPYLIRALSGDPVINVETSFSTTGATRLTSYQPALDEAGDVIGISISVADITERKQIEEALSASEAHYKRIVELNPQVLWIMDPQGRNLDVTPRWDKTTGLLSPVSKDQKWLANIHPDDLRKTVRAIAISRRTASTIDIQYRVKETSGNWAWKRARGAPRFDARGSIACWYGSVQDIDASAIRNEEISIQAEEPTSQTSGEILDFPAERRHQALLGLEIMDTPPEAEFDDLVLLASEICNAPISLVSLVDSERQWFKASTGVAVSETPITVSFCAHAIKQEGLFLVEDASKDERFKWNPLVLNDPKIRFYAGMPLYAAEGVAVGTLCVADTEPRSLSPSQTKALAILSHQVQARMELRSERTKLLRSLEDNHRLTTELKRSNQVLERTNLQLEQLATTDALTGILNRRGFVDRVSAEFSDSLRKRRTMSLLVMDVDDFKKRNDQFGHTAGDEALRHVGQTLRTVLRAGDSAARIGGEEFAIILPETTLNEACIVANRVKNLLESSGEENLPRITLSIGITCIESTTADWEALYSQADRAMYEAKRNGKNRFHISEVQSVA
jgi:diguanylate cyclase (GGDEF)-like protein/PAS domain S-box-containing protein